MPAEVVTEAEQVPRRARYLVPQGLPRRGEILAVGVVLVVLAHVLFAQLTIVIAAAFYLITKMTRWRLSWLTVPAGIAVVWIAAVVQCTLGTAYGPVAWTGTRLATVGPQLA